ncbi:hypothetical protein DB313_05600 (plasmid) [Borrelia turcica IST7]|uniref:DUF2634 domain-containing protein n=1 Tax=Borrelia turcica IST7 TaxID=1104446 RepID=A0A386PQ04_9SPIR|nr:hypothetical protein [Borrelia turcica]AYE36973.1 hypothetical protein DB313_05600 [Borrelia turcica IST7]
MDIKVNDNFDCILNGGLKLIDAIEEQKQTLFLYLKLPKGSLSWDKAYGVDYDTLLKILKLRDKPRLEFFFTTIATELQLNLSNIETTYLKGRVGVSLYFTQGDFLEMEFSI